MARTPQLYLRKAKVISVESLSSLAHGVLNGLASDGAFQPFYTVTYVPKLQIQHVIVPWILDGILVGVIYL